MTTSCWPRTYRHSEKRVGMEGEISDDEWAPHLTCQATGAVILDTMWAYAERRMTVLCGHTHGVGQCQPLPNVRVLTGGSEYECPRVSRVIEW